MACGCGKKNINILQKKDFDRVRLQAVRVSKIRELDVQIYKKIIYPGTKEQVIIYEVELINKNRQHIVEVIKYK